MRKKPFGLLLVMALGIASFAVVPAGAQNQTAADPSSNFLTGPNEGEPDDIALAYVREEAGTLGVTAADLAELEILSSYVSSHTGATHVNLIQQRDGMDVFGAVSTVTIAADGSVAHVGGVAVEGLHAAGVAAAADAGLDPVDAVEAAADALDLDAPEDLEELAVATAYDADAVVSDGGISEEPIPATLGWHADEDSGLTLAWQVVIDVTEPHLWNVTVDADTGELLELEDWSSESDHALGGAHDALEHYIDARGGETSENSFAAKISSGELPALADTHGHDHDHGHETINEATGRPVPYPTDRVEDGSSYLVYPMPQDSPLDGEEQTAVVDPADATASPFGWHDVSATPEPDYTITRGNNVHAYTDRDNSNQPDPGSEPDGGEDLQFLFPYDHDEHPQNQFDATVTNLFYWCNVIHDVTYLYGFDEPAGNFQVNNYGRGGVGGDDVRCEAADGGGQNNANFSTPAADGGRPRMQMYLWPGNQFGLPNAITVDGGPAEGTHEANYARFSPAPTTEGIQAEIVYVGDLDEGNATGCAAYTVPEGAIALVDNTNACNFRTQVDNAEDAGAAALIVAHNTGATPPVMAGSMVDPVSIPAVSISQAAGNAVKDSLPTTGSVHRNRARPPMRDGDLDNAIILHEYAHGISNRLVGGPGINCISGEQRMSEGWSDYYGIAMLIDPELDDFDGTRGLVPYALYQEDRSGTGLRPRPYSRDFAQQPFTYEMIATGGWINGGSLSIPHGVGHGWAQIALEMTWDLIDRHGFNPNLYEPWDTGGNNLAMQLVTDGMKIHGCGPSFVDTRDSILVADELLTGGDNQCTIWATWARRGVGHSAVAAPNNARNGNQEAFDTHPSCLNRFESPGVANPTGMNTVRAGANVPLRFDLGSNQGLDVLAANSPFSREVDCTTREVIDTFPENASTPNRLLANARGMYTYNWVTDTDWAGTCRELVLTRIDDGEQHRAYFRFR